MYPPRRALRVHILVPLVVAVVVLGYVFYPGNKWARRKYDSSGTQTTQLDRNSSVYQSQDVTGRRQDFFSGACTPNKSFMKFNSSHKITVLASFPGTGDTWSRLLLEEATGYYTGSDADDVTLTQKGLKGEGQADETVVAVRTHRYRDTVKFRYSRILLVLRSPFHTFWAEFKRQFPAVDPKSYADYLNRVWANFFTKHVVYYKYFHEYWLSRYKPRYVTDYDTLKTNPRAEVKGILGFLGLPVSEERLDCIAEKLGDLYHSESKVDQFDPYTDEMKEILSSLMTDVVKMRNGTLWEDPVWVQANDWA